MVYYAPRTTSGTAASSGSAALIANISSSSLILPRSSYAGRPIRSCDEHLSGPSVCLSVRPSACLSVKHVNYEKRKKRLPTFLYHMKGRYP